MNVYRDTAIEEKLSAYIKEECLPRSVIVEIGYNQNLFQAGIVDSAGLISFIGFVEKEYGLTVPDEDLLPENFVSISAIAHYIRTHRQVEDVAIEEMRRVGS